MTEIVNLKSVRKAKARHAKEVVAEANRAKHGIKKSAHNLAKKRAEKEAHNMNLHKLDKGD
ncbi:MAG: DUF4169 family protein [Alphaproteobacteria bacterium]|nr:DUF4169 family protein [Alphaproteobacteria bacterium]MDE2111425.1 DUF4169 family protein [Alphaproteobacteria bacterium]MDE2493464.1 DUF4169 family protein [Alphaproteobacteria bacterium]